MKHFLTKHSFQPVDTEDFITAFAEDPGQDIRWFIDMWLRRPGHPVLEIEPTWDGDSVEMHIRQVQGPEASMGTVPEAYRAPLSVRVVTESGSEVHPFTLEGREQHLSFPAAEEPRYVRFDADDVLLAELHITKPASEWMAQLADDDAAGRRRAAVALGEMGGDEARAALRDALAGDPFWAVRQATVAGLDPGDAVDSEALRTAAAEDAKSDVRTDAIVRLGASAGRGVPDRAVPERLQLPGAGGRGHRAGRGGRRCGCRRPRGGRRHGFAAGCRGPRGPGGDGGGAVGPLRGPADRCNILISH